MWYYKRHLHLLINKSLRTLTHTASCDLISAKVDSAISTNAHSILSEWSRLLSISWCSLQLLPPANLHGSFTISPIGDILSLSFHLLRVARIVLPCFLELLQIAGRSQLLGFLRLRRVWIWSLQFCSGRALLQNFLSIFHGTALSYSKLCEW